MEIIKTSEKPSEIADALASSKRLWVILERIKQDSNLVESQEIQSAIIDISISGWCRQYDTLPQADWQNRRYIEAYVVDSDDQVIKTQRIVEYYDGTNWVYRHVHFKLP